METQQDRLARKIDRLKTVVAEQAKLNRKADPSLFEFGNTKGPDGTTRPVIKKPPLGVVIVIENHGARIQEFAGMNGDICLEIETAVARMAGRLPARTR